MRVIFFFNAGVLMLELSSLTRFICVSHVLQNCMCLVHTHSWDVVHTYKVQFSNDSVVWKPCMNGTKEAVSEHFVLLFQKPNRYLSVLLRTFSRLRIQILTTGRRRHSIEFPPVPVANIPTKACKGKFGHRFLLRDVKNINHVNKSNSE